MSEPCSSSSLLPLESDMIPILPILPIPPIFLYFSIVSRSCAHTHNAHDFFISDIYSVLLHILFSIDWFLYEYILYYILVLEPIWPPRLTRNPTQRSTIEWLAIIIWYTTFSVLWILIGEHQTRISKWRSRENQIGKKTIKLVFCEKS